MTQIDVSKLLKIGILMSGEKNRDRLLMNILDAAMDISGCDGGTLYIIQNNMLTFRVMVTESKGICLGGNGEIIDMPPVPLASDTHVCSYTAKTGKLVNIPDVYKETRFDFSGTRNYDAMTGYKTGSLLCIPMENDYGEIIGVLQLLNALDGNNIVPFDKQSETVVLSLASQAAICLTNMNYAAEITELFNSLIRVMSTAIDARSPYNANHTRNMVKYGSRFIEWLNKSGNEWQFPETLRDEFLMSVWLHDIGKLVTPVEIMDKKTRLGSALERVRNRFDMIGLNYHIHYLEGKSDNTQYENECKTLSDIRKLVENANTAPYLSDETLEHIRLLEKMTYIDSDGVEKKWLTDSELEALSVRKGTLTDAERAAMQEHVVMTGRMLDEMRFSQKYLNVPKWTVMHHEFINGQGYPQRLSDNQIPREVRLLTILDVFDALTARDRPYKKPMPVEKAFAILEQMADDGQLDKEILALFIQSGAYIEERGETQ